MPVSRHRYIPRTSSELLDYSMGPWKPPLFELSRALSALSRLLTSRAIRNWSPAPRESTGKFPLEHKPCRASIRALNLNLLTYAVTSISSTQFLANVAWPTDHSRRGQATLVPLTLKREPSLRGRSLDEYGLGDHVPGHEFRHLGGNRVSSLLQPQSS